MGGNITYFQNFSVTDQPHYRSVSDALERIRVGKIKDQVLKIRKATDKKQRKDLKNQLPCILFSGEFARRSDDGVVSHSGYAIIDFDHIDPIDYKKKLMPYSWIKAAFVSPSGDGLKVLARIPESIEGHKEYYDGIVKELGWLKGIDTTSRNVSRICFESFDPDIYINPNPTVFEKKVIATGYVSSVTVTPSDKVIPEILDRSVRMILEAIDGEKHATLIRAARLAGGYIASGQLDENEVVHALESAIKSCNIDDFTAAQKTIREGIKYGKAAPLKQKTRAFESQPKLEINPDDDDFSFISTHEHENEYLTACKDGTLKMGLETGFAELDKHFRFKHGNLVIINGHDNVGKSSVLWHFAVMSNFLHKWKWIIFSAENTEGQVRKNLIQYRYCKSIRKMNDIEFRKATEWAYDNFTILKTVDVLTCEQVLQMAQKANKAKKHQGFIIDPYNALDLDIEHTKLSSHEFHYKVTSQLRSFCKRNAISIYLNTHAVTEALRKVHKDGDYAGFPMAPSKADTEGGGKFSNRADDFLTVHRYVSHPTDFMITEIHVRKIKETETGGRPTMRDQPFRMRMEPGGCGFRDVHTGATPLSDEKHQPVIQHRLTPVKANDTFYNPGEPPF